MQRRFSLYQRGRTWYASLFNPTTGKYMSGRSTGEFNRNAAAGVAVRWLEEGVPEPARGRRPIKEILNIGTILEAIRNATLTLGHAGRIVRALKDQQLIETAVVKAGPGAEELITFLERFWSYETSPYVRAKLAHGHRIGRRRCYECTLAVRNYWRPFFQGKRLSEIRRDDVEQFSLGLAAKGLKPKTVNNILDAGTVALRWAHAKELIPADPGRGLMKFSGKPGRRGVLTEEETIRLFTVAWAVERARIGNILAMSTGLRAGEVLAIQVRDIGADRLYVRHSWSEIDHLKGPKTEQEREVPLSATVRGVLLELALQNPHNVGPSSFVFWSTSMADRPMDQHFLLDGLKAALVRLTLTEEDLKNPEKMQQAVEYWKSRRITVHSWRHYYAARMADRLEARKVMTATGHRNGAVFQVYADHCDRKVFEEVKEAATEAFGRLISFRQSGSASDAP